MSNPQTVKIIDTMKTDITNKYKKLIKNQACTISAEKDQQNGVVGL